jgi:C_GCAxxG_C_C family probable redox protein
LNRADLADDLHGQKYSCSQSVLGAFAEDLGLDRDTAFGLGAGFSGGLGGRGEVCGALTGAIMAAGMKHGWRRSDDAEARATTEWVVNRLVERFEERHGSTICKDLLGHPVSSNAERAAARESGLITVDCGTFIRHAADLLDEVLAEADARAD